MKVLLTLLLSTLLVLTSQANAKSILLTENNSVAINQPITSEFIGKKTIEVIQKAAKLPPGADLYLILNTPGGEVFAGMLFVDTLNALHVKVHTITLFAASMGYQFAQHLGERYIISSGTLMSHRAAVGGVGGQINGELNSRVQFFTDISNLIDSVSAKRVGLSLADYQKAIVNELWVTGENAVKSGHADAVAQVSCDKALASKTKDEIIDTLFGTLQVTFSGCPLVTVPLDIKPAKGIKDKGKAVERVKSFYSNMPRFVRERL
jgi:ATP-dependent protease ClpP protease subunit